MNVQEIIDATRTLPPDEKQLLLLALEADVRAGNAPSEAGEALAGVHDSNGRSLRDERLAWLKANRAVYGGSYVVLDGVELLGTASSYREGREIALAKGIKDAFVGYLLATDEEGEMGGGW